MNFNYYPPIVNDPKEGEYGIGPHTDWGILTILATVGACSLFDYYRHDPPLASLLLLLLLLLLQLLQRRPEQLRLYDSSPDEILFNVFQDGSPGLDVWLEDEWKEVPHVEGAYLVNVGDLLSRWTNDTLRSTRHRVVSGSIAIIWQYLLSTALSQLLLLEILPATMRGERMYGIVVKALLPY